MPELSLKKNSSIPDQAKETALNWAKSEFNYHSHKLVTNHSWAKTYLLSGSTGDVFFKVLPRAIIPKKRSLKIISDRFAPLVPEMMASDPEQGFFLYRSHNGKDLGRKVDHQTKCSILSRYAEIQVAAISLNDLAQALPGAKCSEQFDQFLALLDLTDKATVRKEAPGNPFLYLRTGTVQRYLNIFLGAETLLRNLLRKGDTLPATINHCDLRTNNVARRPEGEICIFDWDDAVYGPPGLSLHSLFSGCARINVALNSNGSSGEMSKSSDQQRLDIYMNGLTSGQQYTRAQLLEALPATACAGVLRHIVSFAPYPIRNEKSQNSIARNVRRRLSDLLNLIHDLAVANPDKAPAFASVLRANGRADRADRLTKAITVRPHGALTGNEEINNAKLPGVFPTVTISTAEHEAGAISADRIKTSVEIFREHGALLIQNAIPLDLINRCMQEFDGHFEAHQTAIKSGHARRVGNLRFMLTLGFSGAFADSGLYASPFVMPILSKLLHKDAILGSLTAVASLPGARDQSVHRDNPPLFEEASAMVLPSFCVAMIVPLIPLNERTGATRIIKGSHRLRTREIESLPFQNPVVDIGSCYLMDSRLFHQGMANNSDSVRPIVSLVYQRPWYRDHKNFKAQSALDISPQELGRIPKAHRGLVSWAVEAE